MNLQHHCRCYHLSTLWEKLLPAALCRLTYQVPPTILWYLALPCHSMAIIQDHGQTASVLSVPIYDFKHTAHEIITDTYQTDNRQIAPVLLVLIYNFKHTIRKIVKSRQIELGLVYNFRHTTHEIVTNRNR